MKVKKLSNTASIPSRAHDSDAGYDLYADESIKIYPGQRELIATGIAIQLDKDMVGLIHPRSGLAVKHGITVLNSPGTVDSGYTGEVKVNLINLGDVPFQVEQGDRIAQLVIQRVEHPSFTIVNELSDTDRGENGHGSTG